MGGKEIRDMLKRDFGYELEITGGSGQSREDPIEVLSPTTDLAVYTELMTLLGLGKGRGIFWRSLGAEFLDDPSSSNVLQRKIETKQFTETKIFEQTENYYFRRVNLESSAGPVPQQMNVHHDMKAKIFFPNEIGWLHYDGKTDYEKQVPGLGYSLAYDAPGTKSTVYIYPIPSEMKAETAIDAELLKARNEIIERYGEDFFEHEWDIVSEKGFSKYYYMPREDPSKLSSILVSSKGDYFIKIRTTHIDEMELRAFANDFAMEVLDVARRDAAMDEEEPDPVLERGRDILDQIENAEDVRGRDELCARLGISVGEFNDEYVVYRMTLEMNGEKLDADIDQHGIDIGAITEEEAKLALENAHQWVLNRIAVRYVLQKRM